MQNKIDKIRTSAIVVDIETSANYPDGREINIRTNFEDYVTFAKVKWVGMYSFKNNQQYYFNALEQFDEIERLLQQHSVIIGFNSEEFDFPILVNNHLINPRFRYLQVDCMNILGTANQKNKKGYKFKNRGELMDYKFKNNSLKCMAETMKLDHQKGNIDYKIFSKSKWTEEEIKEIKKYLYNDVMAVKQMFDKLWYYWLPFAELLPEKYRYDLSWIRSSIASVTYKAACNVIGVEPTYSETPKKIEEMGGRVIQPKYEECNGVWYIDYQSLYPHVFAMFNLCNEVNPNDYKEDDKCYWHGNKIFNVKGYYDISKYHSLSKYIAEKLKERITLKDKDPKHPMVYTLKILCNALYGVMRSPIFEKVHTPNCGWDCCWLSQQIQELTEMMMKSFGFETVGGDTDSIFLKASNEKFNNKDYVQNCLNQIIEIINDNVPFPISTFSIKIEHYLDYILFPFEKQPIIGEDGKHKKEKNRLILERKGKKKNYLYIYKDEKGESQIELVGLPIKKDNATVLGMKIYDEILKPEIIKNNRAKFTKEFIEKNLNNYLENPEIMELISQEYKVNTFSSYKTNCIQAQISKAYFNDNEGIIRLIKNNKIGKCGKGMLYCTVEEAINAKLTKDELDLEKVNQELSPFILYEESNVK